ncbi:MAG: cytochrome P450 [Deltaproteobacteria bacterium]|jgi:cytochrome P450|nr:cytochrome P450 [Deltaproteobacteria bacterium]MBW2500865.1 cytochrome P450 [Deltaproteobacteria bacterium]
MIDYDPYSDPVMRDPWPYYAQLRREAPVFYHEKYDTWFLSKFEDIRESTRKDVFTIEQGVTPEMVILKAPPPPDPVFSMLDMPRQRDYRRMFVPRYTRNAVRRMEGELRALAREILAPLAERGSFDVYRDLADPLATYVIGDLIGLPREEVIDLREKVARFYAREPGQVGTTPENESARVELMTRVFEIIQERMAENDGEGDDHISVMLRTPAEGKPLSLGAMAAAVYTMLVTGAEVVPLSVANTAYYLWSHPDQRREILGDSERIHHAYAESLRYDQPTNLLGRFVKDPVEIRGQRLEPGQGVMFLWASGNRDEEEFERADVFDVTRRPKRTLSFGHGAHKCIGEHLGMLEGRVLLEELLALAPEYEVEAGGAERAYGEFLHGYHRMPIEFEARALPQAR